MWTPVEQVVARIRAYFSVSALDKDLDDELESHVASLTDENVRRGMRPEEARRAALVQLGGREPLKELHRRREGFLFWKH